MNTDNLKGICRLSLVAMRTQPDSDAPLLSQLLFGEHYTVLETKSDWCHIELHFDHSQGWIRSDQHAPITEAYFDQVNLSDYKVCTDIGGTIFFQKKNVQILLGSVLPISTNELFKLEEQVAFNGESKSMSQRREFEFMKTILKHYHHAPFLIGGKSPYGIDGAAFVQQVFKICGYRLPRTFDLQLHAGQKVETELKEGDLIFSNASVYLYLGSGQMMGVDHGAIGKIPFSEEVKNNAVVRRVLHDMV